MPERKHIRDSVIFTHQHYNAYRINLAQYNGQVLLKATDFLNPMGIISGLREWEVLAGQRNQLSIVEYQLPETYITKSDAATLIGLYDHPDKTDYLTWVSLL